MKLIYPEHIEFLKIFQHTHDIRLIGQDKYELIKELESYDLLETISYKGWVLTYKGCKYIEGKYKEIYKNKGV
jgi:hypothetical protein